MKQSFGLSKCRLSQSWMASFQIMRTLCCVYLSLSIPLRCAFIWDFEIGLKYLGFVLSDLVCTLFFFVESFSTHIFARGGCVRPMEEIPSSYDNILNRQISLRLPNILRRRRWFSLHFLLSILITLPLEYITLMTENKNANMFLLNRTLRLLYLPSYLSDIARILEVRHVVKNIGLQRTWKLFFTMALAGHWCGCIFFLVARFEAVEGDAMTWPQELGVFRIHNSLVDGSFKNSIIMEQSISMAYIQSLYWAYITMITTGFGDIVPLTIPETIWCIFSMYVGVVITTCTIANLQLLVTNMDAALTGFQYKLERLQRYMHYRKLPHHLQSRIFSFYDYQWDLLKGADEEKFLEELPRSLQQQVANFLYRDLISSIPALRKANNALLNALTECCEMSIYSPHDEILSPGEHLRGALLVSRGEVEILDGHFVERKMQRFDRYAEESLFQDKVNEKLIRSKTFSEVFLLPSSDFQSIIKSQCDLPHILQMRETSLTQAKSSGKANKMFGSAEDTTPTHGFNKHCHPDSAFRIVWDCIIILGLSYYTFSLPLSIMKCLRNVSFQKEAPFFILGYLVDGIFLADLLFKYNFFMFTEEGIVQHNRECIRDNFMSKHNVWREIFIAIPVEFLVFVYDTAYLHLFRFTKIARLLEIGNYANRAERLLEELKFGINQSARRVIKLNLLMIIVCHWVGCLWYLSADVSKIMGLQNNWRDSDENNFSIAVKHSDLGGFSGYLRSVYWAIVGMSTVGYGDIIPTNAIETTVATVVILFGGLVLPAVVGGLAAYMGNLNSSRKNYKAKNTTIQSIMRRSHINKAVVDKVSRYYDYLWSCQGGVDEQNIMDELSGPLWDKVAMHVNGEDIKSISFFSICDDRTKNHLVALLRPRVFLPGDIISHQGEIGKDMFLIEHGQVVVTSNNQQTHFCILGKGDYFGESSLLGATFSIANVVAMTYCDCFVLTKDDFNEVMLLNAPVKREMILASINKVIRKKHKTNINILQNFQSFPKCKLITKGTEIHDQTQKNTIRVARFHPDSAFRQSWNVIILISTTYNAWMIPFRLSFSTFSYTLILDWVFDIFFIFDIYLKFSEFSYIDQGELISDRDKVKKHYLRGSFWMDFFASFPFDLVIIFINKQSSFFGLLAAILRIPKLIRLGKLFQMLGELFHTLEDMNFYLAPIQLIGLLSGVILIAHWAACGFYALARWRNNQERCGDISDNEEIIEWGSERTECMWIETWIQKQIVDGKVPPDGGDMWQLYLRSFNWALPTLVVVVIGDVVPITSGETLYVFLWMVVGVTINATIIGNVANLVANLETDSSEFLKKADDIKQFMHMNAVNLSLQDRIEHFMNYLWTTHRGMSNENVFIKELPVTLQTEITDQTRMNRIKDCVYFDFCSDEIVKALTLCLKPVIFSVGDILIYAGDMGQEMYFLDKGTVQVVSSDGKTLYATLTDGSFFGEISLFFKQKRSSTVRAVTFCEVFQLDKKDLDDELRQRDFDFSRMMDVFNSIAASYKRRNDAVTANLKASQRRDSKLHKMIIFIDEIRRERQIMKIFLPNSVFRTVWDIFSMFFTVYFIIISPYRVAFTLESDIFNMLPWLAIDFFIDFFFILDIVLRYRYFGFIHDGKTVKKKGQIRKHYYNSGMFLDIISSIPLEIMSFWLGLKYIFIFRMIHFVRVHRLPYYFSEIDHYLNLWKVRIRSATNLLLRMFFFYAMVNHWCACMWFIIHRYFERNVQFTWATTDCPGGGEIGGSNCLSQWDESLQQHNICNGSIYKCYIRSVYFVITTISTVGYGDISPVTEIETLWEDTVVLIGACFFAGIIGAFTAYLSQNDTSGSNAFRLKLQKLQEYMTYRALPKQLQNDIIVYHKHKWNQTRLLDVESVLSILSIPLQMELSFEVSKHVISCVPVLNKYDKIVQKRITHAFMLQMSPANSIIYDVGDIGWDIYFIGSGLIQITLPSDLSKLDAEGRACASRTKQKYESTGLLYKKGNHFGESCLNSDSGVRQEKTTAKSMAEMYLISKDDLESIWSYVDKKEREKMRNDLMVRNGNTWHFFDKIDNENNGDSKSENCTSAASSIIGSTGMPNLSPLRKNRRSIQIASPVFRRSRGSEKSGSIKNMSARLSKELARKPSFSAASISSRLGETLHENEDDDDSET